jgi:hypothetical protein
MRVQLLQFASLSVSFGTLSLGLLLSLVCPPAADPVSCTAAASSSGLLAATSLARAAQGVVRAEVLVDASKPIQDKVWQALFG